MAGNTKEIPTTTINTNGEYNGNWNISDRTLGILPKGGVDALTKSCAAEHTASSQFRSCSDLDQVNQWISHFEPAEFREFLGSSQTGYRFSTGSVDTTHQCSSSLQPVGSSVNGVGEVATASPVFFPNNLDRARCSSVSTTAPSFPLLGQTNGFPGSDGMGVKRRKSSFQITSITAPDRSKHPSGELDRWDSVEDMLSAADDTGSDTQDTSQSTVDYNENVAASLDAVTTPTESFDMSGFISRKASTTTDNGATNFAFDAAPGGILNIGTLDCSSTASTSKPVLSGTDKSKDPRLNVPSVASSAQIANSFRASDSTSECNKPTCPINEIHSRFKIVKILNRIRGRWKCTDCIGLPMSIAEGTSPKISQIIGVGNAHANDSIPFVCPQESGGVLQHPVDSLFAGGYNLSTLKEIESRLPVGCDELKLFQANQSNLGNDSTSSDTYVLGLVPLSHDVLTSSSSEAVIAQEESLKSNDIVVFLPQINHHGDETTNLSPSVVAVPSCTFSSDSLEMMGERLEIDEGFATSSEISTRPGSQTAIESAIAKSASSFELDNKIEQAMDLVKTHLMFAVHEEVELLKHKIKELMTKNQRLEYENSLLRVSADPQILSDIGSQLSSQLPPRSGPS